MAGIVGTVLGGAAGAIVGTTIDKRKVLIVVRGRRQGGPQAERTLYNVAGNRQPDQQEVLPLPPVPAAHLRGELKASF
jgi:hypothetical protein